MKIKLFLIYLVVLPFIAACSNSPLISVGKPASGEVSWKLYPDPRESLTRAGEEITFAITPSLANKPFTIFFGDGGSQQIVGERISCSSNNKCEPIYIGHVYQVGKAYYPYITYGGSEEQKGKFKIIIASSDMKSDKEIEKLAINNFSNQLISSLKQYCSQPHELHRGCGKKDTKIALALLTDANFEQNRTSEKIFTIAKDLSLSMLNEEFNMLEKNPQALVRLAHESVVESEDHRGRRKVYKNNSKLEYLSHLDYSLQTQSGGAGNPIIHSIQVEGTNDKEVIESSSEASASNANSVDKASNSRTTLRQTTDDGANEDLTGSTSRGSANAEKNSNLQTSKRKKVRPALLAKFKTADNLLVLHEIEELSIIKKPGSFYSKTYKTDVSKREASMLMNVRLLSREGEILWMKDIKATYVDQLANNQSSVETVIPVPKLYQQELMIKDKAASSSKKKEQSMPVANIISESGLNNIPLVGQIFGFFGL